MTKGRNMVSVKNDTYKQAKQLQKQYRAMGLYLSMEDAVAMVKVRDNSLPPVIKPKDREEKSGGWFI